MYGDAQTDLAELRDHGNAQGKGGRAAPSGRGVGARLYSAAGVSGVDLPSTCSGESSGVRLRLIREATPEPAPLIAVSAWGSSGTPSPSRSTLRNFRALREAAPLTAPLAPLIAVSAWGSSGT